MSGSRPPGRESFYVQNVIEGASIPGGTSLDFGRITTSVVPITQLDLTTLNIFDHAEPLGLAAGYDQGGKLIALAISDPNTCKIIDVSSISKSKARHTSDEALHFLEDKVLCRSAGELFAFDAGPITVSIYTSLRLRITGLVDIQTAFLEKDQDRAPLASVLEIMGSDGAVYEDNVKELFNEPVYDPEDKNCRIDLATRAWLAAFLPTYSNGAMMLDGVARIDTKKKGEYELDMITKLGTDAHRQDYLSPMQTEHKFTARSDENGRIQARADIYKTKFHANRDVQVTVENARGKFSIYGTVEGTVGRTGSIKVDHHITSEAVTTVTSIGHEGPTRADRDKAQLILHALQDKVSLGSKNPWVQNIWFPDGQGMSWPEDWDPNPADLPLPPPSEGGNQARYNPSQLKAVEAMLSSSTNNSIVLIQGPPGTGKTSVIANYVLRATEAGQKGIWLIAQSNVAVKNIAEKLMSIGFEKWRLLVSKDFHYEW
ncbi:hypothetical protein BDN72DRAFT_549686 [Pluteus cervinus]|uniref:Uncharacterized protein n=1 Tax=Pluteus cervinus TaxID=181527 RepID=A0ACD3AZG2_9AGAR|nr:hypothetical protein BDN72DRAFT_549686 [Pluteus cervinus]